MLSPSLRGRGLKFFTLSNLLSLRDVALFTRAWIEIKDIPDEIVFVTVALFTRAWIEIVAVLHTHKPQFVALFTRAWIEICYGMCVSRLNLESPSLRGRGLKCIPSSGICTVTLVALFTRAWIEISMISSLVFTIFVALFTRAWIEI